MELEQKGFFETTLSSMWKNNKFRNVAFILTFLVGLTVSVIKVVEFSETDLPESQKDSNLMAWMGIIISEIILLVLILHMDVNGHPFVRYLYKQQ